MFTQGLHAISDHITWLRGDGGEKSFGVSGPNSVITSIGVSDAKWAGPLSFWVSLVCMVVVSLLTPEPSKEIQDMVDETRIPSGAAILAREH